jgi:tetratricopeptide (TPR) repeat protein
LATRTRDRMNEFRAIDGLVAAHSSVGRKERASELLSQRLTLARQLGNIPEELTTFEAYAVFYEKQGNYQTARNFYERAIALSRTLEDNRKEVQLLDKLTQILKK